MEDVPNAWFPRHHYAKQAALKFGDDPEILERLPSLQKVRARLHQDATGRQHQVLSRYELSNEGARREKDLAVVAKGLRKNQTENDEEAQVEARVIKEEE